MHTPELPKQHKGQITNVAVVIAITSIVATIAVGLLPKKSGPESSSPAGEPATSAIKGTEEIQGPTNTLTAEEREDARVRDLFKEVEAESKGGQKTDEKILADYKKKIAEDHDYRATDDEIEALARLGYGVVGEKNGGGSIPFRGDGRGDNKEKK